MNRKKSDTISIKSIEQNLKQWRQFVQRVKIGEMCQNLKNNYSRLMKLFPPIGIAKDNRKLSNLHGSQKIPHFCHRRDGLVGVNLGNKLCKTVVFVQKLLLSIVNHIILLTLIFPCYHIPRVYFIIYTSSELRKLYKSPRYSVGFEFLPFPLYFHTWDTWKNTHSLIFYISIHYTAKNTQNEYSTMKIQTLFFFWKSSQLTLHLSHKEGNSSSEVRFFCNFLYIIAMDLSTCIPVVKIVSLLFSTRLKIL